MSNVFINRQLTDEITEAFNTHPLRGALFENMVINEMMKERTNRGKQSNLYFYRDQSGREIDVLRISAQYLEAYEIKSSMTYNRDFFKHLAYIKKLLPDRITRSCVIYDGEPEMPQRIEGLYNFRNFRMEE